MKLFVAYLTYCLQGNLGTKKSFIDVSLLDIFPVWAAPSSNLRITLKTSNLKTMDLVVLVRAVVEAKVVGA